MSIQFGNYKIQDEGKMIKDSKRGHYWSVLVDGNKFDIIAKESFVSKKFRLFVNRKLVSTFKAKEDDKKKGFDF